MIFVAVAVLRPIVTHLNHVPSQFYGAFYRKPAVTNHDIDNQAIQYPEGYLDWIDWLHMKVWSSYKPHYIRDVYSNSTIASRDGFNQGTKIVPFWTEKMV